jgi:hypothetical protein
MLEVIESSAPLAISTTAGRQVARPYIYPDLGHDLTVAGPTGR